MASTDSAIRQRICQGRLVDIEKTAGIVSVDNISQDGATLDTRNGAFRQLDRQLDELESGLTRFWHKFSRKGKKNVPVLASLRALAFSSWLNLFVVFLPLAWVGHYLKTKDAHGNEVNVFPYSLTFTFSLLALVPLEWSFDWGGEQMAYYLGTQVGDLVIITLNNVVDAALGIILLMKCDLRLLQSNLVGGVIIHLLLIPGTAFITGGANIMYQDLQPHKTELNHTLLTMGVLALFLPAAFFSAIDRGVVKVITPDVAVGIAVNDQMRHIILVMSRGLAILLLMVYITSRIFLHNPPGHVNIDELGSTPIAEDEEKEPQANQYVLIVVLAINIAIMAPTTEWLLESIDFIRESGHIQEEWFGLFLLPVVSWAANGVVAVVYFIRYLFRQFFQHPEPPAALAKAREIDLSIQFLLFWMPFLVLLGWFSNKPLSFLFDFFEMAIMLSACFIVNYVTADGKTNWAEGFAMVAFYCMIAVCAWFYTGQVEVGFLLSCESVADALAAASQEGSNFNSFNL